VATVLIIGASRGTGLETVKAALRAGHPVRALARSARRIPLSVVKAWLKFSWLLMSWFYNALWLPEVTNCLGRINCRCVNQGGNGKAVRGLAKELESATIRST
jgi:hypothetical protein